MRYSWQPPTPLVLGSLLSLGLALLLAACGPSAAPNTVPAASGGAPAALSGATSAQAPSGGSVEVVHATWANHPQILADAFAKFEEARRARQRLECGGFSAAFARRSVFFGTTIPA